MGLAVVLNNALSGLNVNQQALSVLSQNIANANTKGYSRQNINQEAVYLEGQNAGVRIESVTRKIDEFLNLAVQSQGSAVGGTSAITDYNTRIQALIGQPGNANSIDTYFNTFFNNLQSLAQTPTDTTQQRTVVNSAASLASQMSQLATGLYNLQWQADQQIGQAVSSINNNLVNLQQINVAIVSGKATGQSTAGLEDQRDALVNDIAQYLNVQVYTKDTGAITVSTSNGVPLLDESAYQIVYTPAPAADVFANNSSLDSLRVYRTDSQGDITGLPIPLTSAAPAAQVTSVIRTGQIAGLITMRDTQIPAILDQLDTLAAGIRDQVNAIQNSGSSFPGTNSLTGTRAVNAQDYSQWNGSMRIAVLDANGEPVTSPYGDEPYGLAPLTLDLSQMNTGQGVGSPSVQGIINAINQYFQAPQAKAEVGNLNNIQLVAADDKVPNTASQLNFYLGLNNISSTSSNVFVQGISVADDTGTDITTLAQTIPSIALAAANTYQTINGSGTVTITTASANNLVNGQTVYLPPPGVGNFGGIPGTNLSGYFTISNVNGNSFQITAAGGSLGDGTSSSVPGLSILSPAAQASPGQSVTSAGLGALTADLSGNSTSQYYDITVNMAVQDGNGNVTNAPVTYRLYRQTSGATGIYYPANAVGGGGTLVPPVSQQAIARAILVDANGNELPKVNGQYITSVNGYLKIVAADSNNVIAIDSMDSSEQGRPATFPPQAGTGRGFSYYFNLNDFFTDPLTSTTRGSAKSLQVQSRLQNNPSLLSTGTLTLSKQPADATSPPNYTYERAPGDNSIVQRLSDIGVTAVAFAAAGGLGATSQTFSGYAGQIIGAAAAKASQATTDDTNAQTLLTGFTTQASAISGVNLDTELANTVIYQNAYAATARIISVVNDLYNTLLQSF